MSEISLDKSSSAGASRSGRSRPARPPVERVPTTRTIDLAGIALGVMAAALWARVISLAGNTDTLVTYLTKSNNDADKPVKNYATQVMDDVHRLRVGNLISAIVLTGVTALIIVLMRRTRTASSSRWALLIILILTSTPFYVIPIQGFPGLAQVAGVIAGIGAVAAIVLIFLPQSTQYFRAWREASVPPELRGQPRPSLGSLFRPKSARTRTAPGATATRPPAARSGSSASSAAKAKAKVRSDADAVARGAELARARAKSSKTRRSE